MTLEQIKAEQRMLETQVDLAVQQFRRRCGLEDWQVTVSFGQVEIRTNMGHPPSAAYTTTVSVRV